ncbi:DUF3592 domain-containing protein [Streptomyces sp. 71268]|uniref:DUF3592 domain-containing protein n=1 Tax=Streptomyces sp. 71268 TaxID=3002640 RepID=UPI0023F7A143|nr:DUF3592 domain-containing protein [Streptomyces sp. 71268]WEV23765.1 DUF3592 domain-containing protein [Streptomyces sp. 71268]
MDWHRLLLLWCAACAGWALVGYGWSLAGATRAQRAVRVWGRIASVRTPAHGDPGTAGIPVVIAFPDPATGQEHALPYTAEGGRQLDTVWAGREVAVVHPPGQPQRFQVTYDLTDGRYGLAWPHFAAFLSYAGLVTELALRHGYPWALLCAGGPLTVLTAFVLRHEVRLVRREAARLARAVGVPGRVVAVQETAHDDGESQWTSHAPVLTFTTREGTLVTARPHPPLARPSRAYGRVVTVHYAPDHPEVFTLDLDASRRSRARSVAFAIGLSSLCAATTVAGALMV